MTATNEKHEYTPPKSEWGEGPWQTEPDHVVWRTKAGLVAMIHRPDHGAWCGYVAVPPGHPAHGKHYDSDVLSEIRVHGGLTYANACQGRICHTPDPGEPDDVWWLGFDCVHSGDFAPASNARLQASPMLPERLRGKRDWETYRDEAYVRGEAEELASQLATLQGS